MTRLQWLFHNVVVHPVCGFFGIAPDVANRWHDSTAPIEDKQ